jgi:DNA-binding NarL/FixJ family response regulator
MAIRVLVVDDHKIIREGLRLLFAVQPDLELVGEAGNGKEALAMYGELRPDVVVMDVGMPETDGAQATVALLARHPETKVIALSMHSDCYYINLMRDAGAVGYVLKDEAFEKLAAAIHGVMAGGTAFEGEE